MRDPPNIGSSEAMTKSPRQLVRPEILAMSAYHVSDSSDMVKLDAMENPYRLPPEMRAELGSVLADAEINRCFVSHKCPSVVR